MLTWVLERAMKATGADMGNVQVFDPADASLRIEAYRGFERPFLDYFDRVRTGKLHVARRSESCWRVVVEDVTDSVMFQDAATLEVMLDAGVRAVQSIPLIGGV
jgi:hypothetical protein